MRLNTRHLRALRLNTVCGVALIICLSLSIQSTVGQNTADAVLGKPEPQEVADRLLQIINCIADHHVNPPTTQQLYIDAITTISEMCGSDQYIGLGRLLSQKPDTNLHRLLCMRLDELSRLPEWTDDSVRQAQQVFASRLDVTASITDEVSVSRQLTLSKYVGIGVEIVQGAATEELVEYAKQQYPTALVTHSHRLTRILKDGPAACANAEADDIVVAIDGNSVLTAPLGTVVHKLRGPEGSHVKLSVLRNHQPQPIVLTMVRNIVPIPSMTIPGYSDSRRTIAVAVESVTGSTVHELRNLEASLEESTKTLVLDLRETRGMDLHSGKLLADALVDDALVGYVRTSTDKTPFHTSPGKLFSNYKLVVIAGVNTVGTPEWIARALYGKPGVVVISARMSGFGRVNDSFVIGDSTVSLEMPVGVLLDAKGRSLRTPAPRTDLASRVSIIGDALHRDSAGSDIQCDYTLAPFNRLPIVNHSNHAEAILVELSNRIERLIEHGDETCLMQPSEN